MSVVVVGQIGRDLVLRAEQLPDAGGSEPVTERLERLGGKGANQAVGLAQLGVPVSLLGVAGSGADGATVTNQARADGIDIAPVIRRGRTALLVTVISGAPQRRLFEDVPESALLGADDVERAAAALAAADTVSIQLQQPAAAAVAAARLGKQAGARVVADGAVEAGSVDELLASVDVLRADAKEAELLAGRPVRTQAQAGELAERLLGSGPELVAVAIDGVGDLVAWPGGARLFPHSDSPVVDRTGAGDAFMAGLIVGLRRGASPAGAGELASAAAGATVTRLGGRPDLAALAAGARD